MILWKPHECQHLILNPLDPLFTCDRNANGYVHDFGPIVWCLQISIYSKGGENCSKQVEIFFMQVEVKIYKHDSFRENILICASY